MASKKKKFLDNNTIKKEQEKITPIEWAFTKGIIKADPNGNLEAEKSITKSELATALYIFKDLINKE